MRSRLQVGVLVEVVMASGVGMEIVSLHKHQPHRDTRKTQTLLVLLLFQSHNLVIFVVKCIIHYVVVRFHFNLSPMPTRQW